MGGQANVIKIQYKLHLHLFFEFFNAGQKYYSLEVFIKNKYKY